MASIAAATAASQILGSFIAQGSHRAGP